MIGWKKPIVAPNSTLMDCLKYVLLSYLVLSQPDPSIQSNYPILVRES
jgi:hypothetical protein